MDERFRFVARLLEGEKMAPLCRQFGISRVTGYKLFNRYRECGLDALYDRSPIVTRTSCRFRSSAPSSRSSKNTPRGVHRRFATS